MKERGIARRRAERFNEVGLRIALVRYIRAHHRGVGYDHQGSPIGTGLGEST